LQRIVHDLGLTVVLAEHRLERVVQFADRVIHVDQGRVEVGEPGEVMATSSVAPPVVELARLANWDPVPLSVRDARRAAVGLRDTLTEGRQDSSPDRTTVTRANTVTMLRVDDVVAGYGNVPVLRELSLAIESGEIVALMGRNGAGKSTLLRALVGLTKPGSGSIEVSGSDPANLSPAELLPRICLVPQEPADLLWTDSVARECRQADLDGHAPSGAAMALFSQLAPGVLPSTHPRDLSEGQRMALAIAIMLAASSDVVLLDEPTRGLDYATKRRLIEILKQRAADGCAVLVATHDVELVAEVASRTLVMAEGEVVADGPTSEVVIGSPQFAPQVSKVLAPLPFLTVAGVADAISKAG
jgi:energy-coupling factor transport system ATP-binding protein